MRSDYSFKFPLGCIEYIVIVSSATCVSELTRCLFALGVEPKTVLKLQEEKLMAERTLMGLSDFTICRELRGGISHGQLEILKALRKDIRE